jgi:hypothetical protein
MSNERADEFLSWRGRLTPPEALPEEALDDRETTWQRLADRLEKKPDRRGVAWLIAACVLMAVIPATTRIFRSGSRRVATHVSTRIPAPVSGPHRELVRPADGPGSARHPTPRQETKAATRSVSTPVADPAMATGSAIPTSEAVIADSAATNAAAAISMGANSPASGSIASNAAAAISATSDATANPPSRHPLRIVCLNEMNADTHPSSPSLATRQPSFLHLGTVAAEGQWASSQNTGAIIKIDLPSPNRR